MQNRKIRGRFAPSPTGYMHLGNAFAALMCWLGARSAGGEVILRIEDIDPSRARPEFYPAILDDLKWLGLDWDEGPYTQGQRLKLYNQALSDLEPHTYPCYCSRKDLQQAARRNAGFSYPGLCRNLTAEERRQKAISGRKPATRLTLPDQTVNFSDLILGEVQLDTRELGGDFTVRRSDNIFAYQLAVVVDDIAMGINQVVRGADILESTPRQLRLYELLGEEPPTYAHVPLLVDEDGKKLSKSHQSLELMRLREAGVRPQKIVGYLAYRAGLIDQLQPITPVALLKDFSFKRLHQNEIMVENNIEQLLLNQISS